MSKLRRALLSFVNDKKEDYIQDGLIFCLDATDYSGGNTVPIKVPNMSATSLGYSKLDGGLYSSTYRGTYIRCLNTLNTPSISNATIECCVWKTATGNSNNMVASFGDRPTLYPAIMFHTRDGHIRINCGTGRQIRTIIQNPSNGKYCISTNYDIAIVNLATKSMGTAASNAGQSGASDGYIWIGNGWPSGYEYGFIGYIFSVRLYNRKLTKDEMLFNQSIDYKKFNLN